MLRRKIMKRKIISLTLALMMILSAVVAFPVSAEVEDITVAGGSFTATGKNAGASNSGSITAQPNGSANYKSLNKSIKHHIWADYSFDIVKEGYYDVTISASADSSVTTRVDPATVLEIDDKQCDGIYPAVNQADTTDIVDTLVTKVYLTSGTHKLRAKEVMNARYYLHSFKFSYSDEQTAPTTIKLEATSGKSDQAQSRVFWSDMITPAEGSVSWATKHAVFFYQKSTESNAVLTLDFVNNYAAYYDVIIASAGTTDATMTATIGSEKISATLTATTANDVVNETNLGRIYVGNGYNTLALAGAIGSTYKYLYNVKLVKSNDQKGPPIDLEPSDGTFTSTSHVVNHTTIEPTTKDADWIDKGAIYMWKGTTGNGVNLSYTVKKAAYYDVYAAIGYKLTGGQVYARFDGAGTLQCEAIQTTDATDVKSNSLGRIYLPEGSSTLELRFAHLNTGEHLYLYDIRLQESENQTEAESIILNAGHAKATSGHSEQNVYKNNVGTNSVGWATNGRSKLSSDQTSIDLDMYVITAGSYDVYAAAGTTSASAALSLRINGTEVIDKAILTKGTFDDAQETHLGKVELPAGSVSLRAESDANSGAYYLYNLKFVKSTEQPVEKTIKFVDENDNVLASEFNAGTKVYAEIEFSDDVKLFIANYQNLSGGFMKLVECKEGNAIDGVIRTPLLTTTAGIVKVFVWENETLRPIEFVMATVN